MLDSGGLGPNESSDGKVNEASARLELKIDAAKRGRIMESKAKTEKVGTETSNATTVTRPPSAIIDTALRLTLVAALVYACLRLLLPFTGILLWSAILAVMLYPLHRKLAAHLSNAKSATLIGATAVLMLSVPLILATTSLGSAIIDLAQHVQKGETVVPPPPPRLAELPLIGKKLNDFWILAETNAPAAIAQYGPQLKTFVGRLATFGGGLFSGGLSFIFSLVIAAILIAFGKSAAKFAENLFARVVNDESGAKRLVSLTASTIRGVALGVLGVAAIQALLVGIGFFAIGLQGATLLTLLVFILGIAQIPGAIVTLPVIIYVFAVEPTMTAIIFGIWTFVAGISDNILKPLLLGRGLDVPMPVIFLGVVGGLLADGLLGLFIGPVVLAIGYLLLLDWIQQAPNGAVKSK